PGFLRAQVYDIYTPTGWKRRSQQISTLDANQISSVDEDVGNRRTISIAVTSAGRTGDNVFSVGQPRRVDRPVRLQWADDRQDVTGALIAGGLDRGSTYQAVGSVSVASEEQLRLASLTPFGSSYPDWVREPYTELPPDLPGRVGELAQELTALELNAYDKAVAIETYLRAIPNDLNVPATPRGRDAIDYFLFDAQRGYFDYHASAMVVLLRSVGIPSRLAVGYVLQEDEKAISIDRYRVTEQSAFAWPEVYFPGLGWVEFNPTPSQPRVLRSVPQQPAPGIPSDARDLEGTLGLENLPGQAASGDGALLDELASNGAGNDRNRWVLTGILAAFAALAMAGAGTGRYLWVRGMAGLSTQARLWEQTVRLASWARMPPQPAQTPREYARALRERVPELDGVETIADGYVRERFGQARDEDDGSQTEAAWRSVRAALLRRLLPGRRKPSDLG
ncbi:MAG: transglutaminase domain-containing protein, partial [Dehalococcoidia bacterium]